jgi:hypothetical protein
MIADMSLRSGLVFGGPAQEAFRPAGRVWQSPVEVTHGQYGDRPQVAFNEQGDALAMWSSYEGGDIDEWVLESASMPVGGPWQAPVAVSAFGLAGSPNVELCMYDSARDAVGQYV